MGNEQEGVDSWDLFGKQVMVTARFVRSWRALPPQMQALVKGKVALLLANRRHPSLRAHRLLRHNGAVWECAISSRHRLLYRWCRGTLWLCDVGGHHVVDRCHLRKFSAGEQAGR